MAETKPCPFCAETIRVEAVKCRFCGEMLAGKRAPKKRQWYRGVIKDFDGSSGTCSFCDTPFTVEEDSYGSILYCPACSKGNIIPNEDGSIPSKEEAASAELREIAEATWHDDDEDDETSRPSRPRQHHDTRSGKKAKEEPSSLTTAVVVVWVLVGIAAVVVGSMVLTNRSQRHSNAPASTEVRANTELEPVAAPPGGKANASTEAEFKLDGEYVEAAGAHLKSLRGEFLRKKVKLAVRIEKARFNESVGGFGNVTLAQGTTLDRQFRILLRYTDIPEDLKEQLEKQGVDSGSLITIWGNIFEFGQYPTEVGGVFNVTKDACYMKVDRWQRMQPPR